MRCDGPAASYIALDLETTGLEPRTERITEFAALRVENGTVTDQFSTLVNPERPLGAHITQLTGLTDELLAGAPVIGRVIGAALEFCGALPILGHNILFDYRFLVHAAANAGLSFPREGIDTLALCRQFMPEGEKRSLGNACAFYGITPSGAHRALADAQSAHLLYQELLRRYGQENEAPFQPRPLLYKAKREQPATKRQKEYLQDLIKCHRINITLQTESLSRSEASRLIDQIILRYGRLPYHSY